MSAAARRAISPEALRAKKLRQSDARRAKLVELGRRFNFNPFGPLYVMSDLERLFRDADIRAQGVSLAGLPLDEQYEIRRRGFVARAWAALQLSRETGWKEWRDHARLALRAAARLRSLAIHERTRRGAR